MLSFIVSRKSAFGRGELDKTVVVGVRLGVANELRESFATGLEHRGDVRGVPEAGAGEFRADPNVRHASFHGVDVEHERLIGAQ
jgi:hypothetical protein